MGLTDLVLVHVPPVCHFQLTYLLIYSNLSHCTSGNVPLVLVPTHDFNVSLTPEGYHIRTRVIKEGRSRGDLIGRKDGTVVTK